MEKVLKMPVSKAKYNVLKLQFNDMYERGSRLLESNRLLKSKLVASEVEKNSLRYQLTTARRNLAQEENRRAQDNHFRSLHGEREIEELRRQNALLRDLITSQGVVINEVFNR